MLSNTTSRNTNKKIGVPMPINLLLKNKPDIKTARSSKRDIHNYETKRSSLASSTATLTVNSPSYAHIIPASQKSSVMFSKRASSTANKYKIKTTFHSRKVSMGSPIIILKAKIPKANVEKINSPQKSAENPKISEPEIIKSE